MIDFNEEESNALLQKMYNIIVNDYRTADGKVYFNPPNVLMALQTLAGICLALSAHGNEHIPPDKIAEQFFDGARKIMHHSLNSDKMPVAVPLQEFKKCLN